MLVSPSKCLRESDTCASLLLNYLKMVLNNLQRNEVSGKENKNFFPFFLQS